MCGITGVFSYHKSSVEISESVLDRMTEVIQHRGPDDDGIYLNPDRSLGFGFRRLSIIDLSEAGHQPMTSSDGKVTIVFNGEVYNHGEIRKSLESKGYIYHSKTDTETILYAYLEYGIDFITMLYGMFAIAIWDSREDSLLLIRDRIGIKPLYYSIQQGAIFFGSEIKSILAHPSISREANLQALSDYLTFLMSPPDQTLFEKIKKLEAGHYLLIRKSGDILKRKYWELDHRTEPFSDSDFNNESFCIENIRRLLRDSIKLRMMSDVPFGVMLSGGIDSSLNVALMSELMSRPVETFSVGYKDLEKYNELGYARQISNQFQTRHHEIFLEESSLIDFLPKMIWHLDEPNADPVCVPMYFVSKLARESGTIVAQVGEGSDEQFAGYKHYLREIRYHNQFYHIVPKIAHSAAHYAFQKVKPFSVLTDYLRRSSLRTPAFMGGAISFTDELKALLVAPQYQRELNSSHLAIEKLNSNYSLIFKGDSKKNYLQQMIYLEFKNRLSELLLMRVDKMSMAASIEARVPFLDHRLVEFSFRIPQNLKIRKGIPKYILKKASEGIIPNEIIYRRKQGFAAPIREWFRTGNLTKFAKDHIFDSQIMSLGIFDKKFILTLFDRHINRSDNHDSQLWTLLILSMWYDQFITQKKL